jgi:ubiquitin-protein ligase
LSASLRERRIEQEWLLLQELAAANPGLLEVLDRRKLADSEDFQLLLHETEGIPAEDSSTRVRSHQVRLSFPRFYPAAPLEAYLAQPVKHPNVDPRNGFVCLWTKHAGRETVVEALRRLQEVIVWKRMNLDNDHLMQPAAVAWHADITRRQPTLFPLPYTPLKELPGFRLEKDRFQPPGRPRKRLEPL